MEFLNCGDRLLVGSALSDLEPATSNSKTPPLDSNKGMDMVVKVAMECHKHQVGLEVNKGMDNAPKLQTKAKNNWWQKESWCIARINERSE